MASPAEVVQQLLINAGVCVLPPPLVPGQMPCPCYAGSMPDDQDVAVEIHVPTARMFGRRQRDGKQLLHPALVINIRSLSYGDYSAVPARIVAALDAVTKTVLATSDGSVHYVQSVYRTSGIVDMGEEVGKKRQLWTFNACIAFQDQETNIIG